LSVPRCPDHDQSIETSSPEELWALLKRKKGSGALLAPVVRARKGSYLDVFTSAARAGFEWAIADGLRVSTDQPPRLAKSREHSIDLVVAEETRLDGLSIETLREALRWGQGSVHLLVEGRTEVLSTGGVCGECGFSIGEIDPRTFSFNTLQGQCDRCEGKGWITTAKKSGRASPSDPRKQCPACNGARLSPFARRALLQGYTYPAITALSV